MGSPRNTKDRSKSVVGRPGGHPPVAATRRGRPAEGKAPSRPISEIVAELLGESSAEGAAAGVREGAATQSDAEMARELQGAADELLGQLLDRLGVRRYLVPTNDDDWVTPLLLADRCRKALDSLDRSLAKRRRPTDSMTKVVLWLEEQVELFVGVAGTSLTTGRTIPTQLKRARDLVRDDLAPDFRSRFPAFSAVPDATLVELLATYMVARFRSEHHRGRQRGRSKGDLSPSQDILRDILAAAGLAPREALSSSIQRQIRRRRR